MPSVGTSIILALLVALIGSFYQLVLQDLLFVSFGIGRAVQSIDEFPYTCRRLEHSRLEGCEDLWLDDEARALYAGCSGTESRKHWNQAMDKFNATGRRPGGSELIKLNIDHPGKDGLFNFEAIKPIGYTGATSDNSLDILGFDAQFVDEETVDFYFVNQRPPVDDAKNILDGYKHGANSTIEIFQMKRGDNRMRHLRTVYSPDAVYTPNRVAVGTFPGSFFVTNDHSTKLGWRKFLDTFIGGGSIAHCDHNGECRIIFTGKEEEASPTTTKENSDDELFDANMLKEIKPFLFKTGLKFPNGLARGPDGLIYVPSSVDGQIRVFTPIFTAGIGTVLKQIDSIHIGMPLDNVSPDAIGDLYVPGFPKTAKVYSMVENPWENDAPSTIWRIKAIQEPNKLRYKVEKILEDRDSKILSGCTTVRHDARTGRLFMASVVKPFLTVCDPK